MKSSNAYFHKVKKCIDSCENVRQLNCMRKFVITYFRNMQFVGLQGFVGIELQDYFNNKLHQLRNDPAN